MTEIGRHDDIYRSTPLEQKLAWFQNAPGLSAVEPAREFMAGAAALYTDSDSTVRATLRSLGADWTGDAATNAGSTLQRAANWSHDAGASHGVGGETVGGYGESFEFVRGQVHWDNPWAWGWNDTASAAASVATLNPAPFLGNLTSDYFTTAQQNRTNDVAAVAALRAHEEQTRNAVDTFPSIQPASIAPQPVPSPNPGGQSSVDSLPTPPAPPAGGGTTAGPSAGVTAGAAIVGGLAGAARSGGPGPASSAPGSGVPGIGPGGIPIGQSGAGGPGSAGRAGAAPGGQGADPGGLVGGAVPGAVPGAGGSLGGRAGDVPPFQGGTVSGGVPGSDPRLRGGVEPPGGAGGGALRTPPGAPLSGEGAGRLGGGLAPGAGEGAGRLGGAPLAGEGAGRIGVGGGLTGGAAGGWRDVIGRAPTEPGLISRGPGAGPEFASRLPSGGAAGGMAGAAGMPFLGGMGVGAGGQSTEHRNTYWVRSAEPFDVPLPPHVDAVLHGGDA